MQGWAGLLPAARGEQELELRQLCAAHEPLPILALLSGCTSPHGLQLLEEGWF